MFTACVVTRSTSQKTETDRVQPTKSKSFSLADYPVSVSREELAEEQKLDETLKSLFELVNVDNEIRNKAGGYFIKDGVLLRKWSPHADCFVGDPIVQVVVPVKFRPLVLETAHDKLAGHAGVQKTYDRMLRYFHWPRVKRDVASFVKTCKTCQLTGKPVEAGSVASDSDCVNLLSTLSLTMLGLSLALKQAVSTCSRLCARPLATQMQC